MSPQTNLPPAQRTSSAPPSARKAKSRSLEIDVLRILCATFLFYFHVGIVTHWPLYAYATYASGTFIALAGYCAVRYSRHREALLRPTIAGVSRYFFDRFLAVYPAYAAITLAVFAGSFLYPAVGHQGHFTVTELICNLLMINQYIGMEYFTAMMWFVPFVLQLYLLVPLLSLIARRFSWQGLIACSVVSLLASMVVYGIAPLAGSEVCKDWSPLFRLAPAFLGVACGIATSTAIVPGLLVLWLACSASRLLLLPWWPGLQPTIFRSLYSAAMFPALLGIAWVIARQLQRCPDGLKKIVTLLSQATLPFFLGHGILIHFLWSRFGSNPSIWVAYFVFCWLWSILFTIAYLHVVRWLRDRFAAPLPVIPPTGLTAY